MNFKRTIIFIVSVCLVLSSFTCVYGASSSQLKAPSISLTTVKSTGKTKVTWNKVNKAVSYKVYSSTNKSKWSLLKSTKSTGYTHEKAIAGKTYYYKVKAIAKNSKNNSKYSAIKSRVCRYKYPMNVTAKLSGNVPKLTWGKITNAKKYKVERSYSKSSGYYRLTTTSNRYFTDKYAKPGKTVYYRVTALNSKGNTITKNITPVTSKAKSETLKTRYVAKPSAPLYTKASNSSSHITIPYMSKVRIGNAVQTSSTGGWNRIYYNNKLYYTWMKKNSSTYTDEKSDFVYTGRNEYQQEVVDLAKEIALEWKTFYDNDTDRAVGNVIKNGARGFDCSGFVVYVLSSAVEEDVPTYWLTTNIPKLTKIESIYNKGLTGEFIPSKVSLENIQPGDVIFFSQKSSLDHCGIYLGNNEFAHASNYWKNDGVCIMPIKDEYKDDITCIRRCIPKPENVVPANKIMTVKGTCNSYSDMDVDSKITDAKFKKNEEVTLLYTHQGLKGNWGYVLRQDGTKAFITLSNLI